MEQIIEKIKNIVGSERVTLNADMREQTSFKAGGRAALLAEPADVKALRQLLMLLDEEKVQHLILGNGTNTLFKDGGYKGVVIKLGKEFSEIVFDKEHEGRVMAGASALMSTMGKAALSHGLTGFEFASGIPGSIGGGVFMNAGAYGGEIKDILVKVHTVSYDGKVERDIETDNLDLSYRHSKIQEAGDIVVSATFCLKSGDKETISATMADLMEKRNTKQPGQYPSAGSFFKRPEGYFAGKLIQDAGLKGLTVGGAQVSTLHSGFVINIGGATETDITQLMRLVQNTVMDKFGVKLEPEVRIVGD